MNKKEKYKLALDLPYRVDFWKKSDNLGTKNSFSAFKSSEGWLVSTRRYDKSIGGYNKPLRIFNTKDEAVSFLKKKLNYGGRK